MITVGIEPGGTAITTERVGPRRIRDRLSGYRHIAFTNELAVGASLGIYLGQPVRATLSSVTRVRARVRR